MINGYTYHPHSTIPQALADLLAGQQRSITEAVKIDIWGTGEGMDELSIQMERNLAVQLGHTLEDMRRFRVKYADGYVYTGYLACVGGDSWFACRVDLFLIVKTGERRCP